MNGNRDLPIDDLKPRVRLWLRGEKAFGLSSLPAPARPATAGPARRDTSSTAYPRAIHAAPARPTAAAGGPAPRPPRGAAMLPPAPAPAVEASADEAVAAAARSAGSVYDLPVLGAGEKASRLRAMDDNEVKGCTLCRLCEKRTKTVFGEGDPDARIFFIGEGPGRNEDQQGRPFIGPAGQLLDKMIAGMGLSRGQVFIANVVKCRAFLPGPPPRDRAPAADEMAACSPYLERQIETVRPRVIVTLGRPAATHLLQTTQTMGRLRGVWREWRGVKVMPTYHPSYVLRIYGQGTPQEVKDVRQAVWGDLKQVMGELGLQAPPPRRGQEEAL